MIHADKVSLSYDGAPVLEDVTLSVPRGAHIALMGPSGCGKSSLLHMIAGLCKPTAGTMTVSAERLSYVFQEPRLLPWLTAAENVAVVCRNKKAASQEAEKWLRVFELDDASEKLPAELSGGMQQRVNLARALAYDCDLLLLDEPMKGLDTAMKQRILAILRDHCRGRTLVLATHDPAEAELLADSIYRFRDRTFQK